MKLTQYLAPIIKWWWLVILSTAMAAVPAYVIMRPKPPVYMARTTLIVGRAISDPNPNGAEFSLAQQLAQAYAGIAMRQPVYDATMKALGLKQLPVYKAQEVPNSPFIEILVTDTDPKRAQIVADELANQLILTSPTPSQQKEQDQIQFINQQLDNLKIEINNTQNDIATKQQALANTTSAIQISQLNDDIQGLETKLTLLQTNYATLVSNTQQGAINTLSVIEPASVPTQPIGPKKLLIVLLAAVGGFIFSTGAAYLIEFLDRSLKTSDQVSKLVQLPVIGYIGNAGRKGGTHAIDNPRSPISEAFRSLRANLEFSGVDQPLKTIVITSPDASDGKTLVAINLAVTLSQTEKKVILLDCDLRRANVHQVLGLNPKPGLSEVFREHSNLLDAVQYVKGQNLAVITAGSIPPNPAELLDSNRMKQILGALSEIYDVIIMDCAPLMTTDALTLSAKVDGVVLVTRYAHTTENALKAVIDQLKRANARVVGVVLNRITRSNGLAYRYYASGYYSGTAENPETVEKTDERLNKVNFIPGVSILKKYLRKRRKETQIDLISDDYLFDRITPGQELGTAIKPFIDRAEDKTKVTTEVHSTKTAGG